jgi:hypothetical protein
MRKGSIRNAVIAVTLFASAHSANAHGIAGNRFFVGTLTFDDPSIADEAIAPNFSTLNRPTEGANAIDNRFDWSFTRLLTRSSRSKLMAPGSTAQHGSDDEPGPGLRRRSVAARGRGYRAAESRSRDPNGRKLQLCPY